MSFDWKDYIRLAENLITHNSEAYLRSGISRAYYGVFCITRNKAGFKNYKQPDVHREVINYYKDSKDQKKQKIGNILDQIRRFRNIADYDEDKPINSKLAQKVLIKSKDILKILGILS